MSNPENGHGIYHLPCFAAAFLQSLTACLDISEKMCYHILYRRSDLGVVSRNPEFGREKFAVSHAPLRRFSLSERSLRKLSDPAVKSEYSLFNSIQLSFLQYTCHRMYFRSDLTSKVHILQYRLKNTGQMCAQKHICPVLNKNQTEIHPKSDNVQILI